MRKLLSKTKLTLLIAVALIVIFFGMTVFYSSVRKELSYTAFSTLSEITRQQRFNFESEIDKEIMAAKTLAENASQLVDFSEALEMTYDAAHHANFEFVLLLDTNGRGVNDKGAVVSGFTADCYDKALKGLTTFSPPTESQFSSETVIMVATPVINEHNIITGAVIAGFASNKLNSLFLPSFSGYGYTYAVDGSGFIIATTINKYAITQRGNLFDSYKTSAVFSGGSSYEMLAADISAARESSITYSIGDQKRLACYAPLRVNDWYIFSIVPEDIISRNADVIMQRTLMLLFLLAMVFLFIVLFVYKTQKHIRRLQSTHIDALAKMAYTDELTGADNLAKFKLDIQDYLTHGDSFVVIKFDIEGFKLINDLHGFDFGDKVLITIADALRSITTGERETFARAGSDEFIACFRCDSPEQYNDKRTAFFDNLKKAAGEDFVNSLRFAAGKYSVSPNEESSDDAKDTAESVFEKVNFAHRTAKRRPDGGICDYDSSVKAAVLREREIETKMENALAAGEFIVKLQPKYRLSDENVMGAESLVRWQAPGFDIFYPGEFIPIFEKNGFIRHLDMYMLEQTSAIIRNWMDNDITPVTISVNFSRLHLSNPSFVKELCAIVDKYQVPRRYIEIELTETTIFNNEELLLGIMKHLHSEGFSLSMDDFGSGYSSLGLLKTLPVDVLKMDRAFFVNFKDEANAATVIACVIDMAKKLGMYTVAEGVETSEQVDFLKSLGCDAVQGYYYAKPMNPEEVTQLIDTKFRT